MIQSCRVRDQTKGLVCEMPRGLVWKVKMSRDNNSIEDVMMVRCVDDKRSMSLVVLGEKEKTRPD